MRTPIGGCYRIGIKSQGYREPADFAVLPIPYVHSKARSKVFNLRIITEEAARGDSCWREPPRSPEADIPEADSPPRKRLLLTTPRPGCEIGESSAAAAARQP
ncbi:hypothetical protein Tco_1106069 [Tanacetum coccineum]